jgi:hypothetical protein
VSRDTRAPTIDEAVEQFLTEHLGNQKGRQPRTVEEYRRLHKRWFSPYMGWRRARNVDEEAIDESFGWMQQAGLSTSWLNQARSLYAPFFRWAKSRRIVLRNPMTEFELPATSTFEIFRFTAYRTAYLGSTGLHEVDGVDWREDVEGGQRTVAHSVDQRNRTLNPQVLGSNPRGRTYQGAARL